MVLQLCVVYTSARVLSSASEVAGAHRIRGDAGLGDGRTQACRNVLAGQSQSGERTKAAGANWGDWADQWHGAVLFIFIIGRLGDRYEKDTTQILCQQLKNVVKARTAWPWRLTCGGRAESGRARISGFLPINPTVKASYRHTHNVVFSESTQHQKTRQAAGLMRGSRFTARWQDATNRSSVAQRILAGTGYRWPRHRQPTA